MKADRRAAKKRPHIMSVVVHLSIYSKENEERHDFLCRKREKEKLNRHDISGSSKRKKTANLYSWAW